MSLTEKESKYLYAFLILSIAIGIFVRFYGIGDAYLEGDEPSWIVSEIKLHHPGAYDARFNLYEHPPVARWFIGLPTSYIDADYAMTVALPPNMNVWAYLAPLKEVYVPLRNVSALFGALSIIMVFLITKNIYGTKAGIWSASVAALSFDMIFYSRWVLSESVFVGLMLLTLYCYIRYLKETAASKRLVFMIMTAAVLTLALSARIFTPMFLIPAMIVAQFIINKGKSHIKENVLFITLVFISTYITFYIIWPPEVRALAQNLDAVNSVSDVLKFSLPDVILNNIFRNSYLYVFGLILLAYQLYNFLKAKNTETEDSGNSGTWSRFNAGAKAVAGYLNCRDLSIIFTALLAVTFLGFASTKYVWPKYHIMMFVALFVLMGKTLEGTSNNKKIAIVLAFLVAINFYFFAKAYPYYSDYQNFDLNMCGARALGCGSSGVSVHAPELKQAMSYLAGLNNPGIITNEANARIFYKGDSIPMLIPGEPGCSQSEIARITKDYKYILYKAERGEGQMELKTNRYMCPELTQLPMELSASFGNYTVPETGEESLKIKIYKINDVIEQNGAQSNSTKRGNT